MVIKNVSPIQFASSLGVQRSGISHILSGRNKPSLDFILKILETFPDVNEKWLLKGEGEMLMNRRIVTTEPPKPVVNEVGNPVKPNIQPDLFSIDQPIDEKKLAQSTDSSTISKPIAEEPKTAELHPSNLQSVKEEFEVADAFVQEKEWVKIIVVFADDTFKILRAQKKRD